MNQPAQFRRDRSRAETPGFGKIYEWTWTIDLSTAARAVQSYLAFRHNRALGYAWPSISDIAARCHINRNHAVAAVAELESAGVVVVDRRAGQSSRYYMQERAPRPSIISVENAPNGAQNEPEPVSTQILPTSIYLDTTPSISLDTAPVSTQIPEPENTLRPNGEPDSPISFSEPERVTPDCAPPRPDGACACHGWYPCPDAQRIARDALRERTARFNARLVQGYRPWPENRATATSEAQAPPE